MQKNITFLPQAPVRYNYQTPSMSRRGGTKLHFLKDGVLNPLSSQETIRTRDASGNKLRDVTNRLTGMHSHSWTMLESAIVNPIGTAPGRMKSGVSGSATGTLKQLPSSVRLDTQGRKVYLDENCRRIRTTDMHENPIGAVPARPAPSTTTRTRKRGANVAARPTKSAKPTVPGGTGTGGRITDRDVQAYVQAAAAKRGQTVTVFTPAMMQAGREALKLARFKAAKLIAEADKKAG